MSTRTRGISLILALALVGCAPSESGEVPPGLVLRVVVSAYVGEASPVGSEMISVLLPMNLSSASVRNTLAELTELGLVEKPHASAGRVPTGKIQLGRTVNAFSVFGRQGHFFRDAEDGAADVPVGEYVMGTYEVNRKDDRGVRWQIKGHSYQAQEAFVVKDGATTTLDVGEPFLSTVNVSKRGNSYSINQAIKTPRGDRLSYTRNGSRPPAPKVRITSADGSYDRKFRLEYG